MVRYLKDEELGAAVRLADQIFRAGQRKSMGLSLPKVFSRSLKQGLGCFVGDRLVSFAGMVPSVVRVKSSKLSVYSYGAVCTDSAYRGQGYATKVLEYAKQSAQKSKTSLLFVSGELPIYIEAGLRTFGEWNHCTFFSRLTLNRAVAPCQEIGFREMQGTDWLHVYRIAGSGAVAFEQSIWDLADLIEAGSLAAIRDWEQVTILVLEGTQVIGFIVLAYNNKAKESNRIGQVIEWGGAIPAVAYTINQLLSFYQLSEINWYISNEEKTLIDQCGLDIGYQKERNQGTIWISDAAQLFAELAPYWLEHRKRAEDIPRIHLLDEESEQVILSIGSIVSAPISIVDLSVYVFGQAGFNNYANEDFRNEAQPFFPVPLPYTKGLNFV
ncbi:GNAT family N-acetyltransferase [Paenibacillus sp. GXUN7292]|uniref:GNAT family N-acetyltransferase n=1 Tax=Paenibacillus sp. GXUN7292 TaxID=3422499 RepID=UPI003D7DE1E1